MSIKALQDYTYYSKYARYNKKEGRRETWAEAIDRVKQMHIRKYPNAIEDIEWAFDAVKQKRVLGSQRALQFGGEPCEKKNSRMYNCTSSFCDRIRFFQEAFWLLLCGSGTGFSVQKHHVDKLPKFHKNLSNSKETKVFAIPDTIEGWADALGILLATYLPHNEFKDWYNYKVEYDYSLIRPEGTILASGVGKAPGPEPLKRSLEIIRKLLDRCVADKQDKLKPIDAYDIIMHASDAVLSGGVRRSATIALFSPDDEEMAKAKTGNWFVDNPQRARSNNSAVLVRDEVSKDQFLALMESIKQFGEPGFYWTDSTEQIPNPCFTIDTKILTESGWLSFASLLDKEINILQDSRVLGQLGSDNKEVWEINVDSPNTTVSNLARNVRKTSENQDVYELELECGRKVKATSNHHFATTVGMVQLSDLIMNHHQVLIAAPEKYIANKSSDEYLEGLNSFKYNISVNLFAKSKDFKAGYLDGYFDSKFEVPIIMVDVKRGVGSNSGIIYNEEEKYLSLLGVTKDSSEEEVKESYRKLARKYHPDVCKDEEEALKFKEIQKAFEFLTSKSSSRTDLDFVVDLQLVAQELGIITKIVDGKLVASDLKYSLVKSKKYVGKKDVYCLSEDNRRTLIAEGITARRCVEIGMYPVDVETGESGWQMCNLTEINGKKIKCKEDFAIAARAAAIIGTLQAGYASFPYLGETTEKIVKREALLGVSITGMMDNPDIIFDPANQKEMAELVLETNEWMAKKIGINVCARATCIKPAGTTSCLLGTGSGIHPHHAKRYFRRTQANQMEPVLQYFKKFNPIAIEKSVWSANKKDEVITFCIEVPPGAKTKNDLSALELLEHVKLTQQNWVAYGKRKNACTQPWLSHNVSNTINVREDEWESVGDFIYKNKKYFAGVSLLPASGDLDYPQAPMCNVLNAKEILAEYGEGCLLASGLIVDGLHAFGDLWVACNYATGMYSLDSSEEKHDFKLDWIRRVGQFADRYCSGNIKKCTYMLKHVNNWKHWLDLTRDYKDVDYTQFLEDKDNTKPMDTVACAGGQCELQLG